MRDRLGRLFDGSIPMGYLVETARAAVAEDVGRGDLTCQVLRLGVRSGEAKVIVQESGVYCGLPIAAAVLAEVDDTAVLTPYRLDGDEVASGDTVFSIAGGLGGLLAAERVMLNFVQRMSGIASLTRAFVKAVAGTNARILDTRKTTPGLRVLEKYAVRRGGGLNHRFGLDDGIMIKDNHIVAAGGLRLAVAAARAAAPPLQRVCVEVENLKELAEALEVGVDHVLLDNFPLDALVTAVMYCRTHAPQVTTEASGGIDLRSVRAYAETGVDFVSSGALTHSAPALDLSMELLPEQVRSR